VDRLTWKEYETDREHNIEDLHARLHRGAYRALPSRRVYIPKPDGYQRPTRRSYRGQRPLATASDDYGSVEWPRGRLLGGRADLALAVDYFGGSMSAKLDNAVGLYLEGIRDGRAAPALEKYVGGRYTQHSTGVADGKEGFLAFFTPFLATRPDRDIRIVRAFEDGPYVFVHVYQSLDGGATEWVTTDLFDTDVNDKIVERWDVISAFTGANPSGHTRRWRH
jgi:predicted SnoaL-like aldol condensation-catalyzing enzyme